MKGQLRKYLPELKSIARRHNGVLRADDVVEFARNPESRLHNAFEWDDSKAAEQHRLHQARMLIRVTVEVIPYTDTDFRAFVSLHGDRAQPRGGYRTTEAVLSNDDMRAALIEEALRDLQFWRRKYAQLKEFAAVYEAIDQTVPRLGRKKVSA